LFFEHLKVAQQLPGWLAPRRPAGSLVYYEVDGQSFNSLGQAEKVIDQHRADQQLEVLASIVLIWSSALCQKTVRMASTKTNRAEPTAAEVLKDSSPPGLGASNQAVQLKAFEEIKKADQSRPQRHCHLSVRAFSACTLLLLRRGVGG